jgi:hypothetical protein
MRKVVRRRELLAGAAAAGAALLLADRRALAASNGVAWTTAGAANLRLAGDALVLEAATDVFPSDPTPVAFAVDQRFADGAVRALITRAGAGAGVVLRRRAHDRYIAAVYDAERHLLVLVRRAGTARVELARAVALPPVFPITLELRATGPLLQATLSDALGASATARARDGEQGAGDAGVLATARTLLPSAGPSLFPALGNLRALPYGTQEGQAVLNTPVGAVLLGAIRERSTAAFARIELDARERRPTAASVIAATTGAPIAGGARLHVATDVPARVTIELSSSPDFERPRMVKAGLTGPFDAATVAVRGFPNSQRVYWRARTRRRRITTVGPVRSFRVLPPAGDPAHVRLAIGSCAQQFGACFDEIAARRPDVFIWQGDLNYPDTMGPLAQTESGYAGIWRELLANPRLGPILERGCFVAQRDDHDYGVQDANSTNLVPWGLAPWDALMNERTYLRFSAGLVDLWVLDQRRFKSPSEKTLLGADQRAWLLRTTARSRAPFKLICSPCTLEPTGQGNARDGGWADGYTGERDLVLRHVAERVSGRTLFISGDTHFTMVYDRDGVFEARPCPLGIPVPHDITLSRPSAARDLRAIPGVTYADDTMSHVAFADVHGEGETAVLELALVREDGKTAYRKVFRQPTGGA